ncbi:hypothetical protein SLITO_v1c04040 [Spiroplasma litorale]|uniref:Uncharacterized protein n=1 Tax=Spiroplasma litorale TaxID=216942 RepID=A0A0K1W1S5_9MOLU|nr:hypothetical protein [Spiroplasma litorale]AKX34057.1 hypothetical protein SLITO_v1c04040 [Spiroplasma litorale]
MKKNGYDIPHFNLSAPIRKRINDLVKLNISPTTINIITGEFSKADDETKENIGRYIARLIEIQNEILEKHYEGIKLSGGILNLKQELNITKTKNNLQRIQQIFLKKDIDLERITKHNKNSIINSEHTLENLNFRDAMMIDNNFSTAEQQKKEYLEKIATQKTRINNVISLEKSKLKKAKLLYLEFQKNKEFDKAEKIKLYSRQIIKRIQSIIHAKNNCKNILDIPDSLIDGTAFSNEKKESQSSVFLKIKENMKKSATKTSLNIDLKTFFDVPEFDEKKNSFLDQELIDNTVESSLKKKYKDDTLDLSDDLKKINEINDIKIHHKKKYVDDKKEKIIKKIKKKSKAKDLKIQQVENDKKLIEEELIQLKKDLKVEELRSIELHKKKSIENTKKILKRDRQKYETSFNILEKKWKASVINNFLSSKQKAFNVMTNIKSKAGIKNKKNLIEDENKE